MPPIRGSQTSVFHFCKGCKHPRWTKVFPGVPKTTTCTKCNTSYEVSVKDRISGYFKK